MTSELIDNDVRVGTVLEAERFEKCNKPEMFKLKIDLGSETIRSAAQLGYNHEPSEVEEKQVLCVTDLGEVTIAGFTSEALTVGVPDEEGNPVLVSPDKQVPEGGNLY